MNRRNDGGKNEWIPGSASKFNYRRDWMDRNGKWHTIRSRRMNVYDFSSLAEAKNAALADWERKRKDKESLADRQISLPIDTRKRDNDLLIDLIQDHALKPVSKINEGRRKGTLAYQQEAVNRLAKLMPSIRVKDFSVEHAKHIRSLLDTTANNGKPYAAEHVVRAMRLVRNALEEAARSKPSKIERNVLHQSALTQDEEVYLFKPLKAVRQVLNVSTSVEFNRYERHEMQRIVAQLTDEERQQLRGAARKQEWLTAYTKLMCWLMFETGLRVSEACGLRWSDISFSDSERRDRPTSIFVRYQAIDKELQEPKTKHSVRRVLIGNWALHDALRLHRLTWIDDAREHGDEMAWKQNDFVFPVHDGTPKTKQLVNMFLKRRCAALDIAYRSSHAFRRGYATEQLERSLDTTILTQLLGHKPNTDLWAIYADTHSARYQDLINAQVLATAVQS
jgi:integrase|tara:strand:- start:3366 stop:4715 length:1350 start_codon:yes stop_codon:yes gene_type:complete